MATDFAAVARLLGNDARSAMLDALLDGQSLSASENGGGAPLVGSDPAIA